MHTYVCREKLELHISQTTIFKLTCFFPSFALPCTAPYPQSVLNQLGNSGSSSPPASYSPTHPTPQLTTAGLQQLTQSNIQQLHQLHQLQQLSVSSQLAMQLNGIPFMLREGQAGCCGEQLF